jgi:hypothetical protein
MHSWRLVGEWLSEAEAGAEPHSDLAGPPDPAKEWRLVLAIIGQAAAVATHENPARGIRESNPAAAVQPAAQAFL